MEYLNNAAFVWGVHGVHPLKSIQQNFVSFHFRGKSENFFFSEVSDCLSPDTIEEYTRGTESKWREVLL